MFTEAQSSLRQFQRGVSSTSRNIESHTNKVVSESSKFTESVGAYQAMSQERISNVQSAAHLLVNSGAREDLPTGRTPAKRVHHFVDTWELTQDRDTLLRDRQKVPELLRPTNNTAGLPPIPYAPDEDPEDTPASPIELDVPDDADEMLIEISLPTRVEDDIAITPFREQPRAALTSSASSIGAVPIGHFPAKDVVKGSRIGHPKVVGTLTERSTNVMLPRAVRKVR